LDAFCTFDMFVVITLLLYDMLWHVMTCYDMLWHVMTSGRFQNIPEVRSLQMSSPNFPWTNTQISDSEARALLEKMDAMFSWDLGISEICLDVWDQEHT
jgi:hypothetical protein